MMFKRILVAVDGSSTANHGLKVALELAKAHDATLHVLHVIDDMAIMRGFDAASSSYVPAEYVDGLLAGLRDAGRKVLARAETTARQHDQRITPLLVETLGQSVAHTILAHARKLRAELIVLGTHGRRGLARVVMGSDAEAVVREARVPVLLVRSPTATRATRSLGKRSSGDRLPAQAAQGAAPARSSPILKQPKRRTRA